MHTMKAIDNIKQYTPAALWKRAKEHAPARAEAAPKAPASSWAGKAPIPSGRKWWLTALDIFLALAVLAGAAWFVSLATAPDPRITVYLSADGVTD